MASSRLYNQDRSDVPKTGSMDPDYIALESTTSLPLGGRDLYTVDSTMPLSPKAGSDRAPSENERMEQEKLPLWQAVKRYPKVSAYCLFITVPIVSFGYDQGLVGSIPGVDTFLDDFGSEINGKMDMPGMWLSLFLGLPAGGTAIGNLTSGWLQDAIGRRWTLMFGSIVSAASIALIFFSHLGQTVDERRSMFTAGITLQGTSVGIIKTVCMTYVSENTPTSIRGSAMALFPTFQLLGQLIAIGVNLAVNSSQGPTAYLAAFASQWVLAALSFILSCFLPESPSFLLRKNKEDQAHRAATRLFAPKVDPEVMIRSYREVIEEEKLLHAGVGWIGLVQGTNLRRTGIVLLANQMPALFGLDLLSNANVFLRTTGLDSGLALIMMLVGIILGMLGNFAGLWVLTKVGRRPASIATMAAAGLLWGALGIAGFWKNSSTGYVSAAMMMATIVVCALGCWPAGYAIMGETSSLRLRAKTQAAGAVSSQASSIVMGLVLPYIFQSDQGNLGGKTGFLYTGLCLVGIVMTWFWVPEMKDRSMVEIDRMFELKLPTRKFKHFKMTDETAPSASTAYTA